MVARSWVGLLPGTVYVVNELHVGSYRRYPTGTGTRTRTGRSSILPHMHVGAPTPMAYFLPGT